MARRYGTTTCHNYLWEDENGEGAVSERERAREHESTMEGSREGKDEALTDFAFYSIP